MPHSFWLIALLITPVCGFSQNSIRHGTSLVVERTNDQIAIATDSRVVDGNNIIQADMCKIRTSGKWHFALNGMSTTKGTDVFAVVEGILRGPGNISDRAEAIVRSLTPSLSEALRSDPVLQKHAIDDGYLLGVSVFGREQRVLKLVNIRFVFTASGLSHEQHICPGDCAENRAAIIVPGADTGKFDWNADPTMAARNFVQMEINRNLVYIGPPLQLLHIDRFGVAVWINKPEVCKSQK